MNRKTQLWALIVTSALTAFFQYIIQGSLATGANPLEFDQRFWTADRIFWGIRSLIESWVVVYLFTTRAKEWYQEILLGILELALLALIAFTLGPAFQALGAGTTVYELLGASAYGNWAYAIGAYTSLMMAGAGIAYKIQPFDVREEVEEKPVEIVKEKPHSEYSEWKTKGECLAQIVRFVRDNDPGRKGIERKEIFPAVWNGRFDEHSPSTKYAYVTELIESGKLVESNGNGKKVTWVVEDMSAF